MGNIIGQPLDGYVAKQIEARQALHGSGVRFDFNERTTDQLNILTSNTAWVKLASGVSMATGSEGNDRLKELGFTTTERENLKGMGLAKNYVLFNGISKYTDKEQELNSRQGFNPTDFQEVFDSEGNSKGATSIDNGNSSYIYTRNRRLNETHSSDSGYVPMPGIISMEVKALNRGSLEKAFVKIKAYSRQQLDILDVLYMRLGYTVLLEWGNSLYTTDGKDKKIVYNTVIEDKFFEFEGNRSYLDFIGGTSNSLINSYKDKYKGNYDGMLAIVSNFSWTFNPDGSYDIDLTLISMGDVIESLKTNISIDNGLIEYIKTYTPPGTEESDQIEENKDASIIHSMLWLFKRFGPNSKGIYINSNSTDASVLVGNFLNNGDTTLTTLTKTYQFKLPDQIIDGVQRYNITTDTFTDEYPDRKADEIIQQKYKYDHNVEGEIEQSGNTHYIDYFGVQYQWTILSKTVNTVPNPIDDSPFNTAFKLNTDTPQYYLKFHYLLEFIRNKIIPLIKSDKDAPLFDIDLSQWGNQMYSIPNQISLDPKVCLVRNDRFLKANGSTSTVMHELELFRAIDGKGNTNYNLAYPLNIYLNFNFIIKSLESNQNDRGDVNIYGFISSICTGLNRALGGVNNLEPVIDKDNNILKIIDGTPIPNISCPDNDSYSLNLYGYQKEPLPKGSPEDSNSIYSSNFIRNIDLKTTITPEYATMVTVGATANGYVKGTEATAFSVWNKGIVDRFKNELISPNPSSQPTSGGDEAATNYVGEFLSKTSQCYGFSSYRDPFLNGNLGDLNDDIISKNLSIVTEFYKYIIAKKGQTSKQAGTIGFIPFKLGITMDGISGIKIYNKLNVNSSFLPIRYGDTLNFIITGVSHRLQNNDWETSLDTIVMPKTSKIEILDIGITSNSNTIRIVPINAVNIGDSNPTNITSGAGIFPIKNLIAKYESQGGTNTPEYNIYNFAGGTRQRSSNPNNSKYSAKAITLTNTKIRTLAGPYKGPGTDGRDIGAMGRYQTIPTTLKSAATSKGILDELYTANNQEIVCDWLLLEYSGRANVRDYLKGTNKGNIQNLAKAVQDISIEWAAMPTIYDQTGKVQLGSVITGGGKASYWGGTATNPSITQISVADTVQALITSRIQYSNDRPSFIPTYYKP